MFKEGCRAYASLNILLICILHGASRLNCGCLIKQSPFCILHGASRLNCGCLIKHYPLTFLHI